ncbi:protein vECTL [Proboscivirus elephantidbeta4]|uniref:Protein vECTL n=1 Tax=Elephant endotheliotropic herpesvirus 4 TaxID=548914 RepID=A0A0S1TQ55_9BETA|nr:protein vECTL [Elephant endotheliotropic herpesvirus 4]ALM25952.1 protein vECTL [Elephant endotheliotropic herpesvirus 4]
MLRTPFTAGGGYTKFLTVRTYTRPNRRVLSCLVLLVIALLMICIAQLVIILSGSSCPSRVRNCGESSVSPLSAPCRICKNDTWIWFNGTCYFFSNESKNWTVGKDFCLSVGADLTTNRTEQELTFLKRYKGPSDHWIGGFNTSFPVPDSPTAPPLNESHCFYIKDTGLSSGRCSTERKWICSENV